MIIEVIRFNRHCGNENIDLPFYQVMPEEEDAYESMLKDLLNKGVDNCISYSVELPNGHVNYETNMIKYPSLGLTRHISTIMNVKSYRNILQKKFFSVKEYMS